MKKIPLSVKIIVPVMFLVVAFAVFFGLKLREAEANAADKLSEIEAKEAISSDSKATDYVTEKELNTYSISKDVIDAYDTESIFYTYTYDGIDFISSSFNWDDSMLVKLKDELFANTHGEEINELDAVYICGENYDDYYLIPTTISPIYESFDVPISLFSLFPADSCISLSQERNIIKLYNGDVLDTIEDIAYQLSYQYGHYFMSYYFDIEDSELAEDDEYYKLRYDSDYDFMLTDKYGDNDIDYYWLDHMWYLCEVAANDYVYLMGSPNTRRTNEYLDSLDQLRLDITGKDDELDEYFDWLYDYSFNTTPIENPSIPLPSEIEGLPELVYGVIGLEAPDYLTSPVQAEDIVIEVSKQSEYGKVFYAVTWNKPWEDEGVTYTLVGYSEYDYMLRGIKTIDGTEKARAIIGGAVYVGSTTYSWYDEDFWSRTGNIRLRVIVTMADGTVVVSPTVDWSFE